MYGRFHGSSGTAFRRYGARQLAGGSIVGFSQSALRPCCVVGYAPLSRRYASSAAPSISIWLFAVALLAAPTFMKMFGATSVARMAITTITTRISISVNPERRRRRTAAGRSRGVRIIAGARELWDWTRREPERFAAHASRAASYPIVVDTLLGDGVPPVNVNVGHGPLHRSGAMFDPASEPPPETPTGLVDGDRLDHPQHCRRRRGDHPEPSRRPQQLQQRDGARTASRAGRLARRPLPGRRPADRRGPRLLRGTGPRRSRAEGRWASRTPC